MNGRRLRLLKHACWLTALILLSGCSGTPPATPAHYQLAFLAHPQLSHTAPLKISVLQLASDIDFITEDFWSLQTRVQQQRDDSALPGAQLWLRAGQLKQTLTGEIAPGARFFGIVAQYPAPDGKTWRLSLPLTRERQTFSLWPGSPETCRAQIVVDINGMRVVR